MNPATWSEFVRGFVAGVAFVGVLVTAWSSRPPRHAKVRLRPPCERPPSHLRIVSGDDDARIGAASNRAVVAPYDWAARPHDWKGEA